MLESHKGCTIYIGGGALFIFRRYIWFFFIIAFITKFSFVYLFPMGTHMHIVLHFFLSLKCFLILFSTADFTSFFQLSVCNLIATEYLFNIVIT